ncbi:hypothetical protein MK805_08000 [Shimazuella sp. AN120528]|uniref:hypothetical protein n=1 Tax=Shimazuella soli TaxID=1892854 RepID=UPI001F0F500E|nr:hypothetical protein [Shimazuella soli]MCH5584914.1 hypothetical protein [Shimazuella soli]
MDLLLKIEGKGEAVRDFITFMKTDDRYAIYTSARYTLSQEKDVVEFVFEKGGRSGGNADFSNWERDC